MAENHSLTFEKDIRPILRAHCLDCHGATEEHEGGLDLRLVRLIETGGDSGPSLIRGDAEGSLLLERVKSGDMPPGEGTIPLAEIEILEKWIAQGAPTARPEPETIGPGLPLLPEEREWWSFRPIVKHPVPATTDSSRARTEIDQFLIQAMPAGLSFSPEAEKRVQIIRLFLDLTGLPPTPEQVLAFEQNSSPHAYEELVDQLLSSPAYGERWARHWLDIAGYSDSDGRTDLDEVRPWSYQYRDYVIRSLNENKPLDQFIQEQLAGDEIAGPQQGDWTPEQIELLSATGFLRQAADGTGSGDHSEEAKNIVIADTIQIVTSSLMGLTVACAQCHDHRYDPISHTDYFALRAVFEPAMDYKNWRTPGQRLVSLSTQHDRETAAKIEEDAAAMTAESRRLQLEAIAKVFQQELEQVEEPLKSELKLIIDTPVDQRTPAQNEELAKHPRFAINEGSLYLYDPPAAEDLKQRQARIDALRATKPAESFLAVLNEPAGHAVETRLFHRGDYRQPKQIVEPAAMAVLCNEGDFVTFPNDNPELTTTGRRLAFSKWLTGPANPITARVLVNRIWMHHFGQGLVRTPGDFGKLGEHPTHPELLDWLAADFMEHGWNLNRLHKQMLLSTAYRQSSHRDPAKHELDSINQFYWRKNLTRVDAEVIRDRALATVGLLDQTMFGPPVLVEEDFDGVPQISSNSRRRSLYIQQRRSQPIPVMQTFDSPVMSINCEIRPSSTVATQSLILMNSPFALELAERFAERILTEDSSSTPVVFAKNGQSLPTTQSTLAEAPLPTWNWGFGSYHPERNTDVDFQLLPVFHEGSWKASTTFPDPTHGHLYAGADSFHPGPGNQFSVIRRWQAPLSGTFRITGELIHDAQNGDGLRGYIVSSRQGLLGEWTAHDSTSKTEVPVTEIEVGDYLYLISDCGAHNTTDSHRWPVTISLLNSENSLTWDSQRDFSGSPQTGECLEINHILRAWKLAYSRLPTPAELDSSVQFLNAQVSELQLQPRPLPNGMSLSKLALTGLCQALLTSNEFLYVE